MVKMTAEIINQVSRSVTPTPTIFKHGCSTGLSNSCADLELASLDSTEKTGRFKERKEQKINNSTFQGTENREAQTSNFLLVKLVLHHFLRNLGGVLSRDFFLCLATFSLSLTTINTCTRQNYSEVFLNLCRFKFKFKLCFF